MVLAITGILSRGNCTLHISNSSPSLAMQQHTSDAKQQVLCDESSLQEINYSIHSGRIRRHCTLYTVQALGVQPFHLAPRLLQAARRDKNALTSGTLVAKLLVLGPGPFGFFQGSATLCFMVITGGVGAGTGAGILS